MPAAVPEAGKQAGEVHGTIRRVRPAEYTSIRIFDLGNAFVAKRID